MSATLDQCTVIVLAGGGSQRFAAGDKLDSDVGGTALLTRAVAAAAGCASVIVVGPESTQTASSAGSEGAGVRVIRVQESPPGGGPVAAIQAALSVTTTSTVVVLAGDLPFAHGLPSVLTEALVLDAPGADAVVPLDGTGRLQPLAAAYRTVALHRALRDMTPVHGASMRDLLRRLDVVELGDDRVAEQSLIDIDTTDDLAAVRGLVNAPTRQRP
jgi:molybdopterin-guanine dinucleotide biosynthesis protein A